MGSDFVIVGAPHIDFLPSIFQTGEPVQIKAVLSELAVKAFNEGVLGGFSRLNEMYFHVVAL